MRTVQMTLDEALVREVDRVAREQGTSRSAFTREALRDALRRLAVHREEKRHRKGYELHPVTDEEFGGWEAVQEWGDP
ncbi:MAG: ribbon-helix-helix domain-containing protein [Planctomycetes bacterium]|nr:ribbon-helix-helix domain-containing protein [Planctomycetota bacterium]